MPEHHMKVLLHPTDFSTNADNAFMTACSIARDQEALLIVLHVVHPTACDPADVAGDELIPDRELFRQIWAQFNRLKGMAANTCLTFRIKVGETVDAILHVARDEHCDMIVLTGRNDSVQHYQTHGCISEGVIRRAPCSVLTLRHFHAHCCCESPINDQCHGHCSANESSCSCTNTKLVPASF